MTHTPATNEWDTTLYDSKHRFVTDLGAELITLLAPLPGEHILDLGCGTGHLTQKIAGMGAIVTGLDSAESMIAQARAHYPDLQFVVGDGADFHFDTPFDAVFSNAALHWIKNAPAVVACIAQALKPGGRFVAEFGGRHNIVHVLSALNTALVAAGQPPLAENPWYFPSPGEYATLLEQHGFFVRYTAHFRRPTPLEGEDGLRHWLLMFTNSILKPLAPTQQDMILAHIEQSLRPILYEDGIWTVDYVRLRVIAYREQP